LENKLINYWIAVGIPANWTEAFKLGNIWGLKLTQKHYWENLHENDIVLFYATHPITGVIVTAQSKRSFIKTNHFGQRKLKKEG
jgi:hypothetical protein